ncbi:mitochondrial intermediate peptidase-like [Watersipora subatra]|uniref:mitochondrial intermediate peptidase-like n=1 Tax=Watersipora subatra TaxID=2589382 RepID=UPI00355BD221
MHPNMWFTRAQRIVRGVTLKHRQLSSSFSIASSFNSPHSRRDFKYGFKRSGCLFQIDQLTSPQGFQELKDNVIVKANELVTEATSNTRTRKLVQVFDDLSDELCRVADMADFVRVGHPEASYRKAAEDACMAVGIIVQQMNTNVPLYESLRAVVKEGDNLSCEAYDDTDNRVARLFLNDFEQCGIHLDASKRKMFVELTEQIMALESAFMQATHQPSVVNVSLLPTHLHHVFGITKQATVHAANSEHPDGDVREASYRAYLYPSESQSKLLNELLLSRDKLAKLVGYQSYAERALQGTMTGSPEAANEFLQLLSDKLKPMAVQDFNKMRIIKEKLIGNRSEVNPWDVSYCTAIARQYSMDVNVGEISSYLSLGACMNGLRLLTEGLFGITLRDVTPNPSECWHKSVHKIQVHMNDTDELLGVIYCDFFERAGKSGQDCHFTIQGGRRLDGFTYQIPKVVLMLNLPNPTSSKPTLLSPQQLDNLFHEFGHALHSMIGRTRYQHVTGTRCSTDFAEVPSILMEYFSSNAKVLQEFSSHYETGKPMPDWMIKQMIRSKSLFIASDTQLQVFYSALDQALHGPHPLHSSNIDVLADTQNRFYGLPHVENTAWHLRFGHMVGYGAKYFAYLMSRAIAANIWQHCFKDDPFSRVNGERYMREILQHGGEKLPADMVESLTGTKPTVASLVTSLVEETRLAGNYGD